MGSAPFEDSLWSSGAHDWAKIQESMLRPAYMTVLDALGVGPGMRLLDIGCGAGMAAQLAGARGARVSGLDASPTSVEIARGRTPEGDFHVGDMEILPFADAAFDAVTSFNAIQFAADPVAALRQALRVSAPDGRVAVVVWGEPKDAEHAVTMAAIAALMPPRPPEAPGPFALSAPGKLEAVMTQAGLHPMHGGRVQCPFVYPDAEAAWRGISGAGPYVAAIRHSGEEAVKRATLSSLARFATPDGGYRQNNTFRYEISSAGAV